MPAKPITLTKREIQEIKLCMYYTQNLNHGTAGHNRMVLIATLASALGFVLFDENQALTVPKNVTIEQE